MNLVQPGVAQPLRFASSAESGSSDQDLLIVAYTRVQKNSPEFISVYEGIDQSVDIKISTFVFRAAPEPVISLYDFIMTTFVPQSNPQLAITNAEPKHLEKDALVADSDSVAEGRIRVIVKLAQVQGWS